MPDPRPLSSLRLGPYDDPPSSESSTPRTRRDRLRRALQGTNDLARDVGGIVDGARRTRTSLLSPVNRRRQRSPSDTVDEVADTPGPSAGEEGGRRRSKRRKVDFDTPAQKPAIKYGYYGQVEPGRLKLELISCDGGEHMDPKHQETYLGPKNLLRHDKSVYCSKRPNSSIILKHMDDTPFCLEKLHIVGPEHGFTAPVREGLVYVAMTLNDLQKYIDPPVYARQRNVHSPPYRRRRSYMDSLRSSPERLTLSDALRDPEVSAALDQRERDYARGADSAHDLASAGGSYYGDDFGFGRTDPEAHCDILTVSSSDAPDGIVNPEGEHVPITLLSDEDAGPEESSSQEVLDFRLQRLRLMRRRQDADPRRHEYENRDRWNGMNGLHFDANERDRDGSNSLSRLDTLMARSRVYDSPARDSPLPSVPPIPSNAYPAPPIITTSYPDGLGRGVEHDADSDDNVTCARFHIMKGKHKVAIKFEPAVSGRFIMLKLWANRSNVDVQSVIAKGYGGCRFFPSQEFA
ncbi:hypothetical protein LTR36_009343 [Oleoguttula mirabilis]|uniref:Uncharacterized protein n=1 Tax=Oleoguttula mirabilis TaxID=1507867 RepID=A0AAV9JSJ2_9PEZI|nr:hypothetical protein LTR36_009343 [Oleoguttula mirabilis]